MVSPNIELVNKSGTRTTFKINKVSFTETDLDKNTEGRVPGEEIIENFSSDSQSIKQSQKMKIERGNQGSHKQVSHHNISLGSSRNPLHLELVSKFTTSSNSDRKITCLRKVKTKEPRSVKELFSDYSFDTHQSRTYDELQHRIKSNKTVSYAENTEGSRKPLQNPSGPETEKTVRTESNSKIYDFTGSKKPAAPLVSNFISSGFHIAYHQSLRMPKSGEGTENAKRNSFTRGVPERKSLGRVECVVQL